MLSKISQRVVLFTLASLALILHNANALAVSASKRKRASINKSSKGGGAGFGAKTRRIVQSPLHIPDTSEKTKALIEFLRRTGGEDTIVEDGCQVGLSIQHDGRRGLYATQPFNKGDLLCVIPSDLALALSDPIQMGKDAPTLVHGGRNLLSMYMHNDKQRATWEPYLNSLPQQNEQFSPTPDFFDDEEIDLLEFPPLVKAAKQRKEEVAAIAKESGIDEETLRFATWIVSSRSFAMAISDPDAITTDADGNPITKAGGGGDEDGDSGTIRMLWPYIDLANHADDPNAELHLIDPEKDDAFLALRAKRPIYEGKEITISYGKTGVASTTDLFQHYGFIPDGNRVDSLMIKKMKKLNEEFSSLSEWSTTLEEDQLMLQEMDSDEEMVSDSGNLRKILNYRVCLKSAYNEE